ncbi:hypothetical protein [Streptomyces sp. NPDC048603]|uniref:hypothetical protein n=1 Tax=Streptomyces sp. NPDC048603 TaxID=3365577 RepID=UPI00371A25A5
MATRSARRSSKQSTRASAPVEAYDAYGHGPAALGPVGGSWLVTGKDGRLSAYAVAQGGLLRWTEQTPGGPEWTGPEFFPVADLTHLCLAQGQDGYVHFVGRRREVVNGAERITFHHALQYQTGRPLGPWASLGSLYQNEDMARTAGIPTAAVDANGGLHVFVRNFGKGVHSRHQDNKGKWSKWADIKGSGTLDGAGAFATFGGRVQLLAPAEKRVSLWAQSEPGKGPAAKAEDLPFLGQPGSVGAVETAQDRVTWYWHAVDGSGVIAYRAGVGVMALGGGPAHGAVAGTRAFVDGYDCTILAFRGAGGRTALAAYPTENEAAGLWWTETGEASVGTPGLTVDAQGRIVIACISSAGELMVTRQKDNMGLSLGRWMHF